DHIGGILAQELAAQFLEEGWRVVDHLNVVAERGKGIGHEAVHAHGVQVARHRDQDFHLGYDSQTVAKLLLLILIVVLALWFVRRALRRGEQGTASTAPAERTSDELVRCVQCGVLLPRAEAHMSAGAIYCSQEHVRLGPGKGPR